MQEKYPDRLIGLGCINPQYAGNKALGMPNLAVEELERCIFKLGLAGVKIHPEVYCFAVDTLVNSSFMDAVARRIGVKKVIFGTDHFGDYQKNIYGNYFYVLKRGFPDRKERELIMAGNILQIMRGKV